MDPSLLIFNVLMTYFVRKPRSKGDDEETMPAGKRSKRKQQKRNRKRRQLLERSRRSRDDLINSALEETDVVAFMPTPRGVLSSLSNHSSFCEVTDGPIFSTPAGDSKLRGRTLFINSTPRRRRSISPSPSRFCSPYLKSNSLVLTPVISIEDEKLCGDDETDQTAVQLARITSSTDTPIKTDFKFCWIENLKVAVVTFLNSISSYFWKLYLSFTSIRIFKEKKAEEQIDIASKLDEILNCMTEMSIKQDQFYERQENLFNRLAVLEAKMVHGAFPSMPRTTSGGPPPPPPPPPPMPLLGIAATPQPLEIIKKSQETLTVTSNKPSRPSITLEDILGVQLKKTPAVKPYSERTPSKASTGPRGPLVSVDMIRSVKLKPANMRRRQSLERPLQTPSSIFSHMRTASINESDIEP